MSLRILLDHLVSRLVPLFGSLLIALGFLASILSRRVANRIREYQATNWPTVNGTITTTNVRVIRAESGEVTFAELGYSYQLWDSYYSGYFKLQFSDEQAAWTFVDQVKGQPVVIRHSPKKPGISVLRTRDQGPGFQSEAGSSQTRISRAVEGPMHLLHHGFCIREFSPIRCHAVILNARLPQPHHRHSEEDASVETNFA